MRLRDIFRDWILPIVIAFVIATLINKFLFYQIRVPSGSMYPTIKVGDRIIVTRIYDKSKLKRGDIVVFYLQEKKDTLIKRLIGLPGDKVTINSSGEVFINGSKLDESYVVFKDNLEKSFEVPTGKYLFLGDNRADSLDSRFWKNPYVDASDIKGKAQFVLFPFKRFGRFVSGPAALEH